MLVVQCSLFFVKSCLNVEAVVLVFASNNITMFVRGYSLIRLALV